MTPAHKQTDTSKAPGQVVYPVPEQYLHQYIERKTENRGELGGYVPKRKLTFEEWYNQNRWMWDFDSDTPSYVSTAIDSILNECWKAAQENV